MIGIKHCCTDENKVEETLSDDLTRRDKNKMNKYLLTIVLIFLVTFVKINSGIYYFLNYSCCSFDKQLVHSRLFRK